MNRNHSAQHKLTAALIDATTDPNAPEFMTPAREAMALQMLCREIDGLVGGGEVPVYKLMALCQQALRTAACGMTQSIDIEQTVSGLVAKAVPGAN